MLNLSTPLTSRMHLTIGRSMLLVAIIATCCALYETSGKFAAVRRGASASARLTAVLTWSLAAALPALWVGALRKTPPDGLLARFAIGNGFLAVLSGLMSGLLIIALIAIAFITPSLDWYRMSQMTADHDRAKLRKHIIAFLHDVMQIVLTFFLFIASIPLLEFILR